MKSYRSYSDGNYLKKEDFPSPVISHVTDALEKLIATPGKPPKPKIVLNFDGITKGLVLNMANGDVLFDMTGSEDPSEWIGTRVELYADPDVSYAGKRVGGVRLRDPNKPPKLQRKSKEEPY
jgi:hypothetical protein